MSRGRYGLERRSAVRVRRLRQVRTAAAMVALLVIVLGYLVVQGVKAERESASELQGPETIAQLSLLEESGTASEQTLRVGAGSHSPESLGDIPDASPDSSLQAPTGLVASPADAPSNLPEDVPVFQQALNSVQGGGVGGHGMRGGAPSMSGSGGAGGAGGVGGGGVGGGSHSGDTTTGSTTGKPNVLGKKFSNGGDEPDDAAPNANGGSTGSNGSNGSNRSNDRNGDGNGNNGSNSANASNDRNGDANGNNGKNADKGANGGNASIGGDSNGGKGSHAGNGAVNHDNASNYDGAPASNTDGVKGSSAGFTEQGVNGASDTTGANIVADESPRDVPEPGSILVGIGVIATLARRRAR